jgi:putative transposase
MISAADRQEAVELTKAAVGAGAAAHTACAELGITLRTYQRWTHAGAVKADARQGNRIKFG